MSTEGLPDKHAGAPYLIKGQSTTGNAEIGPHYLNLRTLAYLYYFLELNFSGFGLYMNHKIDIAKYTTKTTKLTPPRKIPTIQYVLK